MTVQDDEQAAADAMDAGAYEEAVRLLQPLVQRDSEYAFLSLGWICETGALGACDEDVARSYYEKAAGIGSAAACFYLGRLFLNRGAEAQAHEAFEAGAQLGDDRCRSELRQLESSRVEQQAEQAMDEGAYGDAVRLLTPLADENSEFALLTLGWICERGENGPVNLDAARAYYERAAAVGSKAYRYLGGLSLLEGEVMAARTAYETGARLGDHHSEAALGKLDDMLAERRADEALRSAEYETALALLIPLADRDSEYALLALAYMSEIGLNAPSDLETARSYYERAAAGGSSSACFDLGRLFLLQSEETKARAAFEAGAARGDVSCMSKLGRMLLEGRGGPADVIAGSDWLEKAAAQGHIFAQRTLLGIEAQKASSIYEKLAIRMKILSLAIKGANEISKAPDSDNMR